MKFDLKFVFFLYLGENALKYMLNQMTSSEEGCEILRLRPRINSRTVDLDRLKQFPEGTLGKAYSQFLEINVSIIVKLNKHIK